MAVLLLLLVNCFCSLVVKLHTNRIQYFETTYNFFTLQLLKLISAKGRQTAERVKCQILLLRS